MHPRKWFGLALVVIIISGLLPVWAFAAPLAQEEVGPNMLVDGDFEAPPTWPMQDGIGEIQVAPGWRAYYLDYPPSYIIPPPSCYNGDGSRKDNGCYWMRPEFRDTIRQSFAYRVRSGDRAQKYFSYGRMHEAGIYQQVNNIPVGAKLRFSIYMHAWMCSNGGDCQNGLKSDFATDMHLRVGIDPTGGTDPFSGNIVWSPEMHAWDVWTLFQVEAIAQSNTVTVFTHSRPQWDDWARMNNDVYIDDAALVTVGPLPTAVPTDLPPDQPQPQPQQPQPQPQPQSQPQTITRPDGTVVHRVSYGDTLLGIALNYGVTVDDIVRLNNLAPGDFLQIDQELIVSSPAGAAPAAQPAAQPAAAVAADQPPPAAAPEAQTTAVAQAGLCVIAFDDQNMNSLYESNEGLVAATQFDVLEGSAVVKSYLTDGSNEPFCFFDLKPGTYVVSAKPPSGYKATSVEKTGVSVAAGQTVNVTFGSIGTAKSSKPNQKSADTTSIDGALQSASNPLSRAGGIVVGVVGLVILLGVGAIGVMSARRR